MDDSSGLSPQTSGPRVSAYTYNANGSLATVTTANGVRHSYVYDSLNRLRGLSVSNLQSQVLHSYTYSLRASGHRQQVVEGGKTTTYAYDALYRLTNEAVTGDPRGNSGSVGYVLDKVGNRESRSSSVPFVPSVANSFNSRDWLSGDTYDANGNTTLAADPLITSPTSLVTDTYDFEDRLIIRRKADGSTVNLSYDADGILRQKALLNSSSLLVSATGYLTDTQNPTGYAQVMEERINAAAGTTVKLYAYGSDLISQTSATTGSSLLNTRYYSYDGLGSVRELTSESGTVTDAYDYDAFGILVYFAQLNDATGILEPLSPVDSRLSARNSYLYRGERFDSDLGQYYLRARFYNPNTGRFWNQDTYEGSTSGPMSLHKYLYANANPVRYADPTGNYATLASTQTIGVFVGTAARMTIPTVARYSAAVVAGTALALTAGDTRTVTAEEMRRRGKAIIGETTIRVLYTKARYLLDAEAFTWPAATEEYLRDELAGGDPQERERILENANFLWINSVMARRMIIYDIGFDEDRVAGQMAFYGKPWTSENENGKYYMMELEWTRGYPLKAFMRIPGSNFASKNIK